MAVRLTRKNDHYRVDEDDRVVVALDGDDTIIGSDGRDLLIGNPGDDWLRGGAGSDTLRGREGDDTLDGGAGKDFCIDDDDDDRSARDEREDCDDKDFGRWSMFSDDHDHDDDHDDDHNDDHDDDDHDDDDHDDDCDDDTGDDHGESWGDRASDLLVGGDGSDVFVFAKGSCRDVIGDFEAGIDRIDLSGYTGIATFDDVLSAAFAKKGNVVIDLYGDDRLVLKSVALDDLSAADFIF